MKAKVMKLFVLLFIAIFILTTVNMVNALGVTATIPVGKAPANLAYDSGKGEIFVTNGQDNTTSVISDNTNTVIANIPVGGYPYGVAYDPAKGEVFVVNLWDNNVMVISDTTNTILATIPVGQSPYNIAYDSAKGELFVTNSYDGTVSVISDSTNTVVATIPVGVEPFSLAYDSGKGEIFAVNFETDSKNYSLSVISDSTNEVVATLPLPGYPSFVVYDPAKGEIFVPTGVGGGSGVSTAVTVISDRTNAVVATISDLNDEVQVEGLAYDSSRGEIFVVLHQNNKVEAISDSTNKVVETITVGSLPWTATYDAGKKAIYVANGGGSSVSVIAGPSTTSSTPNPSSFDFGSIIWIIIIIIIIILLITIILIWLSRQRKFTVTAQNSQTQSPISGATVSASGQQDLSGTTNNKGQTVFDYFKDGDYSIKASATGYIASMPISVSVKNKTEVVIKLNPTPSEAPKLDSSGSGPDNEGNATFNVAKGTQQTQAPAQTTPIIAPIPPPPPSQQAPTEPQGWRDEKIQQIIQKFQEKGAISPQTALTAKELGLSRIFVRIMERRKEQTKIFIEINGKYYLDQLALEEKKQ
ncbi:MAG: carboxypeptidase regulatory-like domain-containing protein [Candidatus Bathyarchaeia archaeon]|jgi:YVTN family beta-propeller protein